MATADTGLFSPTPWEIQQAQQQAIDTQASNFAQMDPFAKAGMLMYKGGAGLAGAVAPMFGGVNVAQQRAAQQQEAMRGLDTTTPEGLLQYAVKLKDINPAMAAQAVAAARKLASDIADEKYKTAHAAQLGALAKKQEAEAAAKEKEDGLKNLPPEVQAMLKLQSMDPSSPGYTQLKSWLDKKMEGKGDWSEPFNLAGATVQKNLQTGEIRTAVSRPPVTHVSMGGAEKPLPPAVIKLQDEILNDIDAAASANSRLKSISDRIDTGELDLGFAKNAKNRVLNALGVSTPESRALSDTQADLEKIRNDSLRLNKGTQTEGDAQRAWNEIMANITDNKLVKSRLEDVRKYNEQAMKSKKRNLEIVRSEYKKSSLDTSVQERTAPAGNRQFKVLGKE